MKFKESNSADGHTVTAFTVRDFELGCSGGSLGLIKVAKLTGSISVSPGGSFRARDDNGRTVFNVKGQINRNKSFGTFRYSGRVETTTGSHPLLRQRQDHLGDEAVATTTGAQRERIAASTPWRRSRSPVGRVT